MAYYTELKGLGAVKGKLKKFAGLASKAAAKALYKEAERIIVDAKRNYVPVDSGNLRHSGFVETPKIMRGEVSVTMGFGGSAAPYAAAVHENPRAGKTGGLSPAGALYKTWAKVGQWKYLEIPYKNAVSSKGMKIRIGQAVSKAIKEGGK